MHLIAMALRTITSPIDGEIGAIYTHTSSSPIFVCLSLVSLPLPLSLTATLVSLSLALSLSNSLSLSISLSLSLSRSLSLSLGQQSQPEGEKGRSAQWHWTLVYECAAWLILIKYCTGSFSLDFIFYLYLLFFPRKLVSGQLQNVLSIF